MSRTDTVKMFQPDEMLPKYLNKEHETMNQFYKNKDNVNQYDKNFPTYLNIY